MDDRFMQALFSQGSTPVGDAVLAAKSGVLDSDVRRTFILFGDPAMQLHMPDAKLNTTMPVREFTRSSER
jgi:hypothetical protein